MLSNAELDSLDYCLVQRKLLDFTELLRSLSYKKDENIVFQCTTAGRYQGDRYLYVRTHPDSKVLAVAHCDFVKYTAKPQYNFSRSRVWAGQLDDRLGVWIITYLLPTLISPNQPYDILLTDNEEIGRSSAAFFQPPEGKQYNWMFEFDRHGTDVVTYDYKCDALDSLLKYFGFTTAWGTFSDICMLAHLDCAGVNIGTGYYNEHTDNCNASFYDMYNNVYRFLEMYRHCYDTVIPYDAKASASRRNGRLSGWSGNKWNNSPSYVVSPDDTDIWDDKLVTTVTEKEKNELIRYHGHQHKDLK